MTLSTSQSLSLLTDLYQLTMAYGYWKSGTKDKEAVFHLFFRKKPFGGSFAVMAGLQALIEYVERFSFNDSDIQYLASLGLFDKEFLEYLRTFKLELNVEAMPEGTVAFPFEPLIRVQGPILHCQLLETPLLNLINFPTLIATKAARTCLAAEGDTIVEFGVRRAQGIDGGITASRSAYIGGCSSTSHVLAGKLFGIPVRGTHAHSWIMSFDTELESFYAYAKAMPDNCIFLVDTYDTIQGVKNAITVGQWLKDQGKSFAGVRLDSGDLLNFSKEARKLLDEAGFKTALIFATGDLNEERIVELKKKGAPIDIWGVGTNLVTGEGQSALDGVYKLSAIRSPDLAWKYKKKLSEKKSSLPGILQVRRGIHEDVVYDIDKGCNVEGIDLLVPIFRNGKLVYKLPSLLEIKKMASKNIHSLPPEVKKLKDSADYPVRFEVEWLPKP